MTPFTAVAIYLTIWWTVLFVVLPLGVTSHHEAGINLGDGGDPGAEHQLVRDDLGVGGRLAKGGHEIARQAHGVGLPSENRGSEERTP